MKNVFVPKQEQWQQPNNHLENRKKTQFKLDITEDKKKKKKTSVKSSTKRNMLSSLKHQRYALFSKKFINLFFFLYLLIIMYQFKTFFFISNKLVLFINKTSNESKKQINI